MLGSPSRRSRPLFEIVGPNAHGLANIGNIRVGETIAIV